MNSRLALTAILMIGALTPGSPCSNAPGQSSDKSGAQKSEQRGASISGRVVNDSGQPIPNAPVYVSGIGRQSERRVTNTDDNGQFRPEVGSRAGQTPDSTVRVRRMTGNEDDE